MICSCFWQWLRYVTPSLPPLHFCQTFGTPHTPSLAIFLIHLTYLDDVPCYWMLLPPFIFYCNNTVVIKIREKWQERKVYRIHPPMKGASVKMLGSFLHSNVFQKSKLSDLALDGWLLTRWKVWTASSQISVNGQW